MTTREKNNTATQEVLYIGLELSLKKWVLCGAIGLNKFSHITLESWDIEGFLEAVASFKKNNKLSKDVPVMVCYEAGQEGFSVYRTLRSKGMEVKVVDSSSIEVSRHKRRKKTDRVDSQQLVKLLCRYEQGDRDCLRVVKVPSVEAEDTRELHREYESLQKELTRHSNRIVMSFRKHGVVLSGTTVRRNDFMSKFRNYKTRTGEAISPYFLGKIEREVERYQLAKRQLKRLEKEMKDYVENHAESKVSQQVKKLNQLKGLGEFGAWKLSTEWFAWREFKNRRELGSAAGLVGVPYSSGESERDRGISKAGNKRIRRLMIQLAWGWLRHQGDDELSQWFKEKYTGTKRSKRVGIVALARKLLIMFWRYLEEGVLLQGVKLKNG